MKNSHMSKMMIKSIADLIEAFGGTAEMAKFLDVGPSAVSNWKAANDIPPGWHLRLFLEAQRRGWSIDQNIFGPPRDLRPRHKGRRSFRPVTAVAAR